MRTPSAGPGTLERVRQHLVGLRMPRALEVLDLTASGDALPADLPQGQRKLIGGQEDQLIDIALEIKREQDTAPAK